jgi:Uri superfamily endonuclease
LVHRCGHSLAPMASIMYHSSMQITKPDLLPREKGSYLLMLNLPVTQKIRVGRLGCIRFEHGWYTYAGSAFGPGGLCARVHHHLSPAKRKHWHIDYLRAEALVLGVWIAVGPPSREHDWAAVLTRSPLSGRSVPDFGCSDCGCRSHLLYFDRDPDTDLISKTLGAGAVWLQLAPSPDRRRF